MWDALENSVSQVPALEGRFPILSNIYMTYNPKAESGKRVRMVTVGHQEVDPEKKYVLATRGYMAKVYELRTCSIFSFELQLKIRLKGGQLDANKSNIGQRRLYQFDRGSWM